MVKILTVEDARQITKENEPFAYNDLLSKIFSYIIDTAIRGYNVVDVCGPEPDIHHVIYKLKALGYMTTDRGLIWPTDPDYKYTIQW